MRLGIMGGTFDPIHLGHLIIGEYARVDLGLDRVIFIPTGDHPLKDNKTISPGYTRADMVDLSVLDNEYFQMSDMEIKMGTTSYTINTLEKLKEIYKDHDLFFIIGTDILWEIERWKDFKDLFKLAEFVLFNRPGKRLTQVDKRLVELEAKHGLSFTRLYSPQVDISSTEIRRRVGKGLSIKYLVPSNVEEYIFTNGLYEVDHE